MARMPSSAPRRAASDERVIPIPRQAAGIISSIAMVVAVLGVAAGLQLATAASGTVSGTVFEDRDADGTIGADEPGVGDVEVVAIDADGNRSLAARTSADGTYTIDLGTAAAADLGDGPYLIEFSGWPSHLAQTPVGPDNGSSVQFAAADTRNVSLGLAEPSTSSPAESLAEDENEATDVVDTQHASIGNLVWLDHDADGFQDEAEPGVASITVHLLDATGEVMTTTVTDQLGRYRFDGLIPGLYSIRVAVPGNMAATAPDVAPGDVSDSDIDGAGQTPVTELEAGELDQSWDAGLVVPTVVLSAPATVSESTPTLAFTGATLTGLTAAGFLLLGLGGSARLMADRIRRTPEPM